MMSQTAATLPGITHAFVPARGQTTRLGAGPRTQNPTTKYSPLLGGTSVLLFHSHVSREEWDRPSYIPLHLEGKQPQGTPQPWPAPGGCSGEHGRREPLPPPPWARASQTPCAPCAASMVSGLDKFLPSEGFVHHR